VGKKTDRPSFSIKIQFRLGVSTMLIFVFHLVIKEYESGLGSAPWKSRVSGSSSRVRLLGGGAEEKRV
jgi:hypothetical protein